MMNPTISEPDLSIDVKYSVVILLDETFAGFGLLVANIIKVFDHKSDPYEILIIANGTEGHLKNQLNYGKKSKHSIRAFVFNKKTSQAE